MTVDDLTYFSKWDIIHLPNDVCSIVIKIHQESNMLQLHPYKISKYKIINALRLFWIKILIFFKII